MEDRVRKAMKTIEENGWVEFLKQCPSLLERYKKLNEFLPEIWLWDPMSARQLVFSLQQQYGLDFGVCPFYEIEGDVQYCTKVKERAECLCVIPQAYCVIRDKDGKPKYPELMSILTQELAEETRDALNILARFL